MAQKTVKSKNGVPIRLSDELWHHITFRHPELLEMQQEVMETIGNPDVIQQGDAGSLMACKPFGDQSVVVIYQEMSSHDGFVVTAYLTRQLSKRRKILWQR